MSTGRTIPMGESKKVNGRRPVFLQLTRLLWLPVVATLAVALAGLWAMSAWYSSSARLVTPPRYSIVRGEVPGLSFGGVQVGQSIGELEGSLHDGWSLRPDPGYGENGYIIRGPSGFVQMDTVKENGERKVSRLSFNGRGLCYAQKPILPFDEEPSLGDAKLDGLTSHSPSDPVERTYFDPSDNREVTFRILKGRLQFVILGWKGCTREGLAFDSGRWR